MTVGPKGERNVAGVLEEDKKPSSPTAWYRRRALLVTVAAVAVLAITVISDLPVHGSAAANISAGKGVMAEINTDIAPCAYAVKESFSIHSQQIAGSLTISDLREAPSLLRDDLAACSFTDDSIFELSNIEVPGSAAGKRLGDLVTTATEWTTSDALGAITDLEKLFTRPNDTSVRGNLVSRERALASDRAAAFADITTADQILDAKLQQPDMPLLPDSTVATS
jgi:hypothetical protein